jgi:hypothetical protein
MDDNGGEMIYHDKGLGFWGKLEAVLMISTVIFLLLSIWSFVEMEKRGRDEIDLNITEIAGSEVEGARDFYEKRGR